MSTLSSYGRLLALIGPLGALVALAVLVGGGDRAPRASAQACNSLTIVKQTVPSPDLSNTSFSFTSVDTAPPATIAPFNLMDGQSMVHTFVPGDDCYNEVTEAVPAGWTLTNIACTGAVASVVNITGATVNPTNGFEPGDDTVKIDVAGGESVTCTFTNTKVQVGSVTICKVTDPPGGTGFTFGWSSPTIYGLPFTLDDGQCFPVADLVPAQGPYSFSEIQPLPVGWQLGYIFCMGGASVLIGSDSDYDPGDTGVTINLGPGENVVCTFFDVGSGPRLWGDVDCDGDVDAVDALKVLRDVAGLAVEQPEGCPGIRDGVLVVTGQ